MTETAPSTAATRQLDEVVIRPATLSDMTRKVEISTWYNTHTLGDASDSPMTFDRTKTNFLAAKQKGYPYLVADIGGHVVGYTYLRDYRDQPHAAELSIYVDHDHLYRGIGSRLLQKLFHVLEQTEKYNDSWIGEEKRTENGQITAVISRATVNPEGREGGEGLPRFYERMGFEQIARLEKASKRGGQM